MSALTFLSLFAGIGGMDLGLERAGLQCIGQVEIDDYATRVLARHWPNVPRWRDVRSVGAHNLPRADLICGGFPCQDISSAGKKAGLAGVRSGLWFEFARIIRELRPRYVLVENVSALLDRGIDVVLGDLAALGYDAEWEVISACAFGAPHTRERLFIIAHADRRFGGASGAHQSQTRTTGLPLGSYSPQGWASPWWATEPRMDSMVYGVPGIVDRLRGLGNAVVPQVAEFVGRAIVAHAGVTT